MSALCSSSRICLLMAQVVPPANACWLLLPAIPTQGPLLYTKTKKHPTLLKGREHQPKELGRHANRTKLPQMFLVSIGVSLTGVEVMRFKQFGGYLKRKALPLCFFLEFPGAVRAFRKRAKKVEKGRKRPISADFQEGRADTP